MTHQILISSPAGSGMNFAIVLLRLAYDTIALGKSHERKDMEEEVKQIAILRNPYDAVASGAERWIDSSNHQSYVGRTDLIKESDTEGMKTVIGWEEKRYVEFFKDIDKLKHVKVMSFDLLINDPEKFIKEAGAHFGFESRPNEVPVKHAIELVERDGNSNRVPREKATARKEIDNIINDLYPKETWECWKIYSDIKEKLDKEGL